jgi:hypothetical protein
VKSHELRDDVKCIWRQNPINIGIPPKAFIQVDDPARVVSLHTSKVSRIDRKAYLLYAAHEVYVKQGCRLASSLPIADPNLE